MAKSRPGKTERTTPEKKTSVARTKKPAAKKAAPAKPAAPARPARTVKTKESAEYAGSKKPSQAAAAYAPAADLPREPKSQAASPSPDKKRGRKTALIIVAIILSLAAIGTIGAFIASNMSSAWQNERANMLVLARDYADKADYDRALDILDKLLIRDVKDKEASDLRDEVVRRKNESEADKAARDARQKLQDQQNLSSSLDKLGNTIGSKTNGTNQNAKQNDAAAKAEADKLKLAAEAAAKAEAERQRIAADAAAKAEADRRLKAEADAEAARKKAEAEEIAKKSREMQELMNRINALIESGKAEIKKGNLSEARKDFQEAIGKFPPNEEKFSAQKYADIGKAYYDAYSADPASAEGQKAAKDSFAASRESIKKDPTLAMPHFTLGLLNKDLEQWDNALTELKEANRLEPKNFDYVYELGKVYYRAKRYEEAKQAFNSASTINPKHSGALFNMALSQKKLGDNSGAVKSLQKAANVNPKDINIHIELGRSYGLLKDRTNSISSYKKALQIDPVNAQATRELAVAYLDAENNIEAERLLESAIVSTNDAPTNYNLALAKIALGKKEEAVMYARRAVDMKPSEATYQYTLGLACENSGDQDAAIAAYTQAANLDKRYLKPRINIGRIYLEAGFTDKALTFLEEAYKIDMNSFETNNNIGNAYLAKELYERAIIHYEKALSLSPREIGTRMNLAKAYVASGNLEKSRSQYAEILKLDGKEWEAYYELGKVYLALKNTDQAKKTFTDLLAKKPDFRDKAEVQRILNGL